MTRPYILWPVPASVDSLHRTDMTSAPTDIESVWPKPLMMTASVRASKNPMLVFSALVSWAWDTKAIQPKAAINTTHNLLINSLRFGTCLLHCYCLKLRQKRKVAQRLKGCAPDRILLRLNFPRFCGFLIVWARLAQR